MRLAGIGTLADVDWAILEPQGKISFIKRDDKGEPSAQRDNDGATA